MDGGSESPRVAIFGPDSLLSVTIETGGAGDEVHIHPGGQGVWVARMAAELGAQPVLCSFLGGETGAMLRPLLAALPAELRLAETGGASGSCVVDRRSGERTLLASTMRRAPDRHEIDDLVAATVAAALSSEVLVICNPFPPGDLPDQVYATLAGNARANGIPVLVDLSSPRLDRTLAHGPDLVKLNDWELAEYVGGPVDGYRILDAAQRVSEAGAGAVVVTRAESPILVMPPSGEPYEIVPPAFPIGHREGCGDAMMGAIAAGWARGLPLRETLVLGAAGGSTNFLRSGLGTGRRQSVEELADGLVIRPVTPRRNQGTRTAA